MLTRKDLALLRAALQFFSEEMTPFDPKLLRHYFDRPSDANLPPDAVARLQAVLKNCEVRYLACNQAGTRAVDPQLARAAPAVISHAKSLGARPATVILFTEP